MLNMAKVNVVKVKVSKVKVARFNLFFMPNITA